MTNRLRTASALCCLLLTAACGSAGAPQGELLDSPADDRTTSPDGEPVVEEGGPTHGIAPLRGHVATADSERSNLANVNVCALNPIFSCTVTDENGNFELSHALENANLELTFFRDDLVSATRVASTRSFAKTLMVPNDIMDSATGATVSAQGGVLVEVVPFTYDVREDIPPVALDLAGGQIEYLGADGRLDTTLSAAAPHGTALLVGAQPGVLHLDAAELAHEGCVFVEGGSYLPSVDVDVVANTTTTVTLGCGA